MANSNYRKLKKTKIKQQLKEQQARKISKELAEQFTTMSEEEWDNFAEALHDEMKQIENNEEKQVDICKLAIYNNICQQALRINFKVDFELYKGFQVIPRQIDRVRVRTS